MGRRFLVSLLLVCSSARGAFEEGPRGGRAVALGGTTVSIEGDPWAAFANPSCLSNTIGTSLAVEYLPALFGMGEIKRGGLSLSCAIPVGTLGISASVFGFDLYRETRVGVAASHELNKRIVLGIGINMYSLAIPGYGSDLTVGLDLGALVRIARGISYGVAVHNVNRPSMGDQQEPLPQSMTMGMSVCPLPGALFALGAAKDCRYPFELRVGVEYSLEDLITLRLGASHEPSTIAAGLGIQTALLRIDYAFTMHPDLGGTHCFSVLFVLPWP